MISPDKIFMYACKNGHINIVNQIIEFIPTNIISDKFKDAFILTCLNGHLNIAQLLFEINPIAISTEIEDAFISVCFKGHLDIAQWLFEINPTINISVSNEYAFRSACLNGKLNIVEWLHNIKNDINIYTNDDESFRWSCNNGHLDVAQWFVLLNSERYKITQNVNGTIEYKIIANLNIVGIKEISELEQCYICCVDNCEVITWCNHTYCKYCISTWLTSNDSCPICRSIIKDTRFKTIMTT